MLIFFMGCYDFGSQKWCIVIKCVGGYDDVMFVCLQNELDMVKISKDFSKIFSWLKVNKIYYFDFIVLDLKKVVVWEIIGVEFFKLEVYIVDGIFI